MGFHEHNNGQLESNSKTIAAHFNRLTRNLYTITFNRTATDHFFFYIFTNQ